MVESAARERLGVPSIAVFRYLDPGNDPARLEIPHQGPNAPEFEVALEYVPYGSSFLLVDDQLSLVNVVSQRARASHPHPLALGVRYFVPNAFAGDSRSNWAKESKTFSVSRPIEVVVLN